MPEYRIKIHNMQLDILLNDFMVSYTIKTLKIDQNAVSLQSAPVQIIAVNLAANSNVANIYKLPPEKKKRIL